jgi:hypothetical protein
MPHAADKSATAESDDLIAASVIAGDRALPWERAR